MTQAQCDQIARDAGLRVPVSANRAEEFLPLEDFVGSVPLDRIEIEYGTTPLPLARDGWRVLRVRSNDKPSIVVQSGYQLYLVAQRPEPTDEGSDAPRPPARHWVLAVLTHDGLHALPCAKGHEILGIVAPGIDIDQARTSFRAIVQRIALAELPSNRQPQSAWYGLRTVQVGS